MIAARILRPVLRIRFTSLACGVIAAAVMLAAPLRAHAQATYIKGDNANGLNLTTSWTTGTVPTSNDVGSFTGTYNTAGSLSGTFGTTASWGGILIGNIAGTAATGTVTIGGTGNAITNSSFTIGSLGIDMSGANQNLVINSATTTVNTSQTWNLASGRNLRLGTTATGGGNARLTGTNANAVIAISGGGVVDLNQGGGSGLADTTGFAGYAGKWRVNAGATLRGQKNGSTAFGSNTAADAIVLDSGTLAVGGISSIVGNWTWNTNITLADGVASGIDNQIATGADRYLKLEMAISGSTLNTGTLVFRNTNSAVMNNDQFGFILAGTSTFLGGMTISPNTFVRLGGSNIGTTNQQAGNNGALAAGLAISNSGVFRLTRNDTWTFANAVSGTGQLKIGNVVGANSGTTTSQVVNMTGTSTYTGDTTIQNGTLVLASAGQLGATGTYAGNLSNAGTFRANTSVNQSLTGTISGAGAVIQAGAGTLTLGGTANTYTGTTTITSGTLQVLRLANGAANSSLGASSNAAANLVFNGGVLTYTGTGDSTDRAFTISASPTINANGTGALTWSGASPAFTTGNTAYQITLGGTSASGVNNSLGTVLADNGTGAVSLRKLNANTWLITATNNTYTGVTTVAGGILGVADLSNGGSVSSIGSSTAVASNLVFNGGTLLYTGTGDTTDRSFTMTAGGGISNNGSGAIIWTGTGVAFTTPNNAYTLTLGGTNTNANTFGTPLADNGTGALSLTKSNAGLWVITGANTHTGVTTISSGTLSISADNNLGAAPGSPTAGQLVINGGALAVTSGFTMSANRGVALGPASGTATGTIDVASGQLLTIGGTVSNNGGTGALTKTGAGTLALAGVNTYSGVTTVTGGTLSVAADNNLGTAPGSATAGSLVLNGGALAVTTGFTLNANRSIALGPASGTATGTIDVATGQLLTIGGTIANNGGTGALTKLGSGTLALAGANTFTGTTTINGGIVQVVDAGSLGGRSGSNGTPLVITSGTLDLAYTTSANAYASATLNFSFRPGNITLAGQSGATTGIMASSSAVTPGSNPPGLGVGSGFGTSITYDATNNPGTATMSAIMSAVGSSGGSLTVTVGDSAATNVEIDFTGRISSSSQTDGQSGALIKAGAGAMRISAANNLPALTVNAGTVIVNNAQALGVARAAVSLVTNNGVIDLNGFSPTTIGLMVGSGTLTNTLAATTGTLTIGNANNQTGTFSGAVADGAGAVALLKLTTGTLGLSGSNSYSGGTTLSAGQINVGNANALGSGPVAVNSGTLNLNGQSVSFGLLTGSSGATITSSTTGSLTFTSNAATSGTFAGTIAAGNGTMGFTKSGAGTLTLTGNNAYTGVTTISGGTLAVSADSNLGAAPGSATAGRLVIAGALSATAGFTLNSNRGIALGPASGDGDGTINVVTGTLTYGGVVANNGAGNDGLVKTGAGRLLLTGVNTYSGATTISSGTLEIGGSGRLGSGSYAGAIANDAVLAFTGSANQSLSGGITGNGTLSKSGAGALTLLGNNTYSGATIVSSGSLVVNGVVSSSQVTMSGGAVLAGSGSMADVTLSGAVVSPGNSPGNLTVNNMSWNATSSYLWQMYDYAAGEGIGWDLVTGTGALTVTGTGFTFNLVSLSSITPDTVGLAYNWSQSTSGTFRVATFAGGISAPAGQWWTVNTGSFTPFSTLTGSFSVSTTANDMFLVYTYTPPPAYVWSVGDGSWSTGSNWDGATAPEGTVDLIFSGTGGVSTNDITSGTGTGQLSTVSSLTFSGSASGPYTLGGNGFTIGSGGVVNQSAVTQTVQNELTLGAVVPVDAEAANLVLSGSVLTAGYTLSVTGSFNTTLSGVVTGSGGILKQGTGTLTLAGANDYTGVTTINSGSVVVGDGATSGVLPGNVTNNASLAFNRSDSVTYAGVISGTGTVTQAGAGTTILTGSNTYTGLTTITGGTLQIGGGGTTGSIAGDVVNGSALVFSRSNALTYSGVVSGAGSLTQAGSGTVSLTGTNTYTGATLVNAGVLQIGSGGSTGSISGSSAVTIAAGGTLAFNRTGNFDFGNPISGAGGIVKLASNEVGLTGSNSFSGRIDIQNTKLAFNGVDSAAGVPSVNVASGATLSIGAPYAGGTATISGLSGTGTVDTAYGGSNDTRTLQILQATSGTFAGVLRDAPTASRVLALVKGGAGTLALSGVNTYTGTTTINAGTLQLVGSGTLSSSTVLSIANAAGATFDLNGRTQTVGGLAGGGATGGSVLLGSGTLEVSRASGSDTFAGVIAGTGRLVKSGAGTLELTGTNTYSGGSTLNGGTVILGNAAALSTGTVTVSGSSTLQASTALTGVNAFGNNILLTNNLTIAGANDLQLSGTLTQQGANRLLTNSLPGGNTLTVGAVVLSGNDTTERRLTFAGSGNTLASGVIASGTGAVGGVIIAGGTVTFAAANTYTGVTFLEGGVLSIADVAALGTGTGNAGRINFTGIGTLRYTAATSGTIANKEVWSDLTTPIASTSTIDVSDAAGSLTITPVGGTRSRPFTKVGAGTLTLNGPFVTNATVTANGGLLVLNGSSSYTGQTTVSTGTLLVGNANALGSTAPLAVNGGFLDLAGFSTTVGILTGSSGATITSNGSGTSTLTVNSSSSGAYAGQIQNGTATVALSKLGTGALTLSASNSFTGGSTIGAGTLRVGNDAALGTGTASLNGGTLSSDGTTARNLANPLVFTADSTLGNATNTGLLTFTGPVDFGGLTRQITAASDVVVSSTITAGTGGLTKAGSGALTLSSANSYSGVTTLSAGTLRVGNNAAIGTGTLALTGGTLSSDSATARTLANPVTVGGGVTLGNATNNGLLTFDGPVDFGGATRTITAASDVVWTGTVTAGAGGLTKTGAGTLTLAGTNSYVGVTTITAGTLSLTSNNSLGGGVTNTTSDTTAVLAFGARTVTMGTGNSNNFYYGSFNGTGTVALRAGSFTIMQSSGVAGTTGNMQALTIPSPTAFALDTGVSSTDRKDFGYINDTGSVLLLSSLTGQGAIRMDANGTSNATTMRFITVNQAIDTQFDGAIVSHMSTGNAARAITFEKQEAGTLTLAGFIGKQTVSAGGGAVPVNLIANGGALIITNSNNTQTTNTGAINTTGTVTITSGTLGFANLALINAAGSTGVASIRMNGGTLRWHGTNTQDITAGGRLTLVSGSTATFDTNGNNVTLATAFGGGAIASPVTKIGAGTLTLTATNTYTGVTTVNGGTLSLGSGGTTGSIAGDLVTNATVVFNRSDVVNFAGTISGTGSIVKQAANALTLSGTNSFSGGATIESGSVLIGNNAALGAGTVRINGGVLSSSDATARSLANAVVVGGNVTLGDAVNNGALSFSGGVDLGNASRQITTPINVTFAGVVSNGGLTKAGGGTLTLSAANTYAGPTTVSSGTLALSGAGDIASGSAAIVTVASGATLDISAASGNRTIGALSGGDATSQVLLGGNSLTSVVASGNVSTFSGVMVGSGGFRKAGSDQLELTSIQAFTGAATVEGGNLLLASGTALASASNIYIASGASIETYLGESLTVVNGQTLGGYGTVSGGLAMLAGGTLSPGGSVGTLANIGATTWNGGMHYLFEVNDAAGLTPGQSPGWDLFTTTGDLTLAITGNEQIFVDLTSLAGSVSGSAANFDPTFNYAWKFAVAASPIGYTYASNPTWFNVQTTNFLNGGPGSFYVARGDELGAVGGSGATSELYVVYAAIPEPGTLALAGIGLAAIGLVAARRRRNRHANSAG